MSIQDDRTHLARYHHIKPAPRWGAGRCGKLRSGTSYKCTRETGHRGPHVAHDWLRRVKAVWEADSAARRPVKAKKPRKPKKPIGLRVRSGVGLWGRVKKTAKFVDEHAEEIALIAFFLAFVWFALDWLMIIMR